ncbi:Imm26 family immunity protein [Lonsdalea quercina]|uniref:Imm26 family immunity protein n=1 Tax=Lonsdalea quercina TaxID=71657 RepID=UPI0039753852
MTQLNLWGWDKKKRTMLRFIKPGDIFCFKMDKGEYYFGRIISRLDVGDVAEIFDFSSSSPDITSDKILQLKRLVGPIILDSYSLFDRKIEQDTDWRIIGHQDEYIPENVEGVYFVYGVDRWCKKVDVFGNEIGITQEESKKYPRQIPHSNYDIKKLLISHL